MGINTTPELPTTLDNVTKTIPSRRHPRIWATLIHFLIRRTPTSRIRSSVAIRMTMLSASHRLSNTKTLLRASERVVSRSSWDFGSATTCVFVVARVGELLGEWRAFTEDGTFPVDDVDGDHEDEGDAEEDCGGVWEMVFAANVGKEWSSGKCEDTCEEITRPSISAGC